MWSEGKDQRWGWRGSQGGEKDVQKAVLLADQMEAEGG